MSNQAEVVIIGGGVIGCAIAYYLVKKGTSVIVLEGSDHIGNGGSSRNGGGVRQSKRDPRELPLAMYGIKSHRCQLVHHRWSCKSIDYNSGIL